jgi:hypothetical protein
MGWCIWLCRSVYWAITLLSAWISLIWEYKDCLYMFWQIFRRHNQHYKEIPCMYDEHR